MGPGYQGLTCSFVLQLVSDVETLLSGSKQILVPFVSQLVYVPSMLRDSLSQRFSGDPKAWQPALQDLCAAVQIGVSYGFGRMLKVKDV